MITKNDFSIFDVLHNKPWYIDTRPTITLALNLKRNDCENDCKRTVYDNINAKKVCIDCGSAIHYQNEYDDIANYYTTHRKRELKRYYDEEDMLLKKLVKCKELSVVDINTVIILFRKNLEIIKKAYKDNKKKNLDYNFLSNKLLNYCGFWCCAYQYFRINKTKKTLRIYNRIWENIVENLII